MPIRLKINKGMKAVISNYRWLPCFHCGHRINQVFREISSWDMILWQDTARKKIPLLVH